LICIYLPDLSPETELFQVIGDEYIHLRAFRANPGDLILVSNGKGLLIEAEIISSDKKKIEIRKTVIKCNLNENPNLISIAVGILENRDRFEFALEKSVESGISCFIPLLAEFSNKKRINSERLKSKAIAAIKQSNQAFLPDIYESITLSELMMLFKDFDSIIVCDGNGESLESMNIEGSILILVGPEGGFSDKELKMLRDTGKCKLLKLGTNILRTETAVTQVLGIINYHKSRT
jgi:16S rRNA (uracil1498-N3)-methyltransferase